MRPGEQTCDSLARPLQQVRQASLQAISLIKRPDDCHVEPSNRNHPLRIDALLCMVRVFIEQTPSLVKPQKALGLGLLYEHAKASSVDPFVLETLGRHGQVLREVGNKDPVLLVQILKDMLVADWDFHFSVHPKGWQYNPSRWIFVWSPCSCDINSKFSASSLVLLPQESYIVIQPPNKLYRHQNHSEVTDWSSMKNTS